MSASRPEPIRYSMRFLILDGLTYRILSWSSDMAKALAVFHGLQGRGRSCYIEVRVG